MTFNTMILSIKELYVTLKINYTEHNNALHHAECSILFMVMLSVVMLNVVMLSVVMPNVMRLCVVVP